ncbi:MAG: recombinase family protein [Candidatus Promineifilaceae bacterium]
MITIAMASQDLPPGLYINLRLAAIVRRAFRLYASGNYSDTQIAEWMNERPIIKKLRAGKMPIGKEMVRDMLQNRVYTGYVAYAETYYSGSLGQGKRSNRNRKQWFKGNHQGFITEDLFDICQEVRKDSARVFHAPAQIRTYILHDRVFCARCVALKPAKLVDKNYGKMRPAWDHRRDRGHYRCIARDRGYHNCEQGYTVTSLVNEQVIEALSSLKIPAGFQERVEDAIRSRVEHAEALKRMEEIEEIVKRIDFSWEQGYLSPQEYVAKREQLQQEIEALRPVDYDALIEAADLLENFTSYWDACETVEAPLEARKQLLNKIIERVFVYDDTVVGIALHGDYGVVLDTAAKTPNEILKGLQKEIKKGASKNDFACTQDGSDGGGGGLPVQPAGAGRDLDCGPGWRAARLSRSGWRADGRHSGAAGRNAGAGHAGRPF